VDARSDVRDEGQEREEGHLFRRLVENERERGSGIAGVGKKKSTHAGRQIVFMAGGMCYSELRSAREMMNSTGAEIVIGSTRCISPKDFTDDLHSLG
jgi:syntaxin-binding protein 1